MRKIKVEDASKETRPRKIVSPLFGEDVEKPIFVWASGRHGAFQEAQILQYRVPKASANQAGCYRKTDDDVAGSEVQINGMCRLQGNLTPAHSPSGPQFQEQRGDKPHHTLRHVPQPRACWVDNAGLGRAILEARASA